MRKTLAHRLAKLRYRQHTPHGKWQTVGSVRDAEIDWQGVILPTANGTLRLDVLATDCLCVRFAPASTLGLPSSYTVLKNDWQSPTFDLTENAERLTLKVEGGMTCYINRADCRLTFVDAQGKLVGQDAEPISFRQGEFALHRTLPADVRCYGLAAQSTSLNLRGKRYLLRALDSQAAQPEKLPALANMPFLLNIGDQAASAIFWDNPSRGYVDIGAEKADRLTFSGTLGELRYYQFSGSPFSILKRYSELIGRLPLPPLWALGVHLVCPRPTSAEQLRAIATECRARQMPCDALYFDLDYMDAFRLFTWDNGRIPTPSALVADLQRRGFKSLLALYPAVKADPADKLYQSGVQSHIFLKYSDGRLVRVRSLAGESALPDFTNPAARGWWAERCAELLRTGIHGFWQPLPAPALTDAVQYVFEGTPTSHVMAQNVYSACMAHAEQVAQQAARPNFRPVVVGRAAQGGMHRYGLTWASDERADWKHLRRTLGAVLNSGLSGLPFSGARVSGAVSDPEWFVRFMQLSAFLPYCFMQSSTPSPLLWAFGQPYEAIVRRYLSLRYQLLPYLYSVTAEAAQNGAPIIRPLFMADERDPALREVEDAFMVGSSLLIAPVLDKGATERAVYLPAGRWYSVFGAQPYEGGQVVRLAAPLDHLPMLVRAGHVLPMWLGHQYVGQKPLEEVRLRVYAGSAETSFYEDSGEGFAYQHGDYRWLYFACRPLPGGGVGLDWRRVGTYQPPYRRYRFEVYGVPSEPHSIMLDDSAAPLWYYEDSIVEFAVTQPFERARIVINKRGDQQETLLRSPLRDKG
jgi:alpha-glucosidase